MQPIIATFADPEDAELFAMKLEQRFGVTTSIGIIGAWGEPWDGDPMVAAWVSPERLEEARHLAIGGTLHDGSVPTTPDDS
jgi:hypothetical protein